MTDWKGTMVDRRWRNYRRWMGSAYEVGGQYFTCESLMTGDRGAESKPEEET